MIRTVTLAVVLLLSTAALAENQVGRTRPRTKMPAIVMHIGFCKDVIPDQMRVLSCLQTNRQKLSKACQVVLQSHGV